jgi:hypothetical protein
MHKVKHALPCKLNTVNGCHLKFELIWHFKQNVKSLRCISHSVPGTFTEGYRKASQLKGKELV